MACERTERNMVYAVKEIFKTLQGEGAMSGRAAVFCRFAGCNLWSGREQDRAKAQCTFCDTDFIGTDGENGGKFKTAESLATEIARIWQGDRANRFVVFTGGEQPYMQKALSSLLKPTAQYLPLPELTGCVSAPKVPIPLLYSPATN